MKGNDIYEVGKWCYPVLTIKVAQRRKIKIWFI